MSLSQPAEASPPCRLARPADGKPPVEDPDSPPRSPLEGGGPSEHAAARAAAVCLALLTIAGSLLCGGEADPLSALETAPGAWKVGPDGPFERRAVFGNAGISLAGRGELTLKASLAKPSRFPVRLRVYFISRAGWMYQAARAPILPHPQPGEWSLDLSDDSTDWIPAGHRRPFDGQAIRSVSEIGLRLETKGAYSGEIRIHKVEAGGRRTTGTPEARIVGFEIGRPPPGLGDGPQISFRIRPVPPRPEDFRSLDVWVRIEAAGTSMEAPAFYDQPFYERPGGSRPLARPVGEGIFRARFPKMTGGMAPVSILLNGQRIEAGRHDLTAAAGSAGRGGSPGRVGSRSPASGAGWRESAGSGSDSGPRDGSWHEGFLVDPRAPAEAPDPVLDFLSAFPLRLGPGGPARELYAPPARCWGPVFEWDAEWGNWAGLGAFDWEIAWRFERVLVEAARKGISADLLWFQKSMLDSRGVYRWGMHPLNSARGGPLAGPGDFFRMDEGLDYVLRQGRYARARYGLSPAVSGHLLAPAAVAPGAAEWHARLAEAARAFLGGAPLRSIHPLAEDLPGTRILSSFERGEETEGRLVSMKPERWFEDRPPGFPENVVMLYTGDERSGRIVEGRASHGRFSVGLKGKFPGETSLYRTVTLPAVPFRGAAGDDFSAFDLLAFDVYAPPDAPGDFRAGVHLRDKDGLWYQALLPPLLRPADWTTLLVDLTATNRSGLIPVGHGKPWDEGSRRRLREIGIHIYGTRACAGEFLVDHLRVCRLPEPLARRAAAPSVSFLGKPPRSVGRYKRWEVQFNLGKEHPNPYDPESVDVRARITTPSGKVVSVPCFYLEPCAREMRGGIERVAPVGAPRWALRYAPAEIGLHDVAIEVLEGGRWEKTEEWVPDRRFSPDGVPERAVERDWNIGYLRYHSGGRRKVARVRFVPGKVVAESEPVEFECVPSGSPGYVRVSRRDPRWLEFDDGSFFYPIGPNLRSPSDSRRPYLDPVRWSDQEIAKIAARGTYQYDDYLDAFAAVGINWTRVWMCPWWGSLEWRRDWPDYQGLGRYSQPNAWRLDHIVETAEEKGIYLNLCLTNHGQLSLRIDREWDHNPYSQAFGGPLRAPMEFFTDGDAKILHANKLRYVVARWGYSTAVMAWVLMSEIEFTEEYYPDLRSWNGPPRDGPAVHIRDWHAEMAAFLKETDLNRRPVGTHFSHPWRGQTIFSLPQLDLAMSNAYSAFEQLAGGRCEAPEALYEYYFGGPRNFEGMGAYGKPVLVEEQGRHWMGVEERMGRILAHNTKDQLDADLHCGLWGGLMVPLAGNTGYWWWLHVHFDDAYPHYRGFASFVRGEDFRGQDLRREAVKLLRSPPGSRGGGQPADDLKGYALRNSTRAYVWVFNRLLPHAWANIPKSPPARFSLGGFDPGRYRIEMYHTLTGETVGRMEVAADRGTVEIELPAIEKDIALKIKKAGG
ncbi:MAG: DUF5060 domain-containing protein [Planctomycetota bacterium]|nr:DUF5060 domain-containing protein [Planctomycetota bacterium]